MELLQTGDGSFTLFADEEKGEIYHSRHGAIQEGRHVFVQAGLHPLATQEKKQEISIFEVGFGTGLNALLTLEYLHNHTKALTILYTACETRLLQPETIATLAYDASLKLPAEITHNGFYKTAINTVNKTQAPIWEEAGRNFSLSIIHQKVEDLNLPTQFDIVYFDAFSPGYQPELWTDRVLGKMYQALRPGGVLVTYCAKGIVKRALKSVGFRVEMLPGPPGKREMIRAVKAG